jgi:DNA replication licensing factor MCM6
MSFPIMSRFDLFFVVLDNVNERDDAELARHILDVHMDMDKALTPKYSPDVMRRFILFARALRPKLTNEARAALVDIYQALRQSDTTRGRTGYRVTVRQLESLIRLSEAMARANAEADVTETYVRAAAYLLKNSIVQTVQEDVDLAEDDVIAPEVVEQEQLQDGGDVQMAEQEDVSAKVKPTFQISFDEFNQLRQWTIVTLKRSEEVKGGQDESEGLTIGNLCEQYLMSVESELTTEEEYNVAFRKIRGVLKHLLLKDSCLLALNLELDENNQPKFADDVIVTLSPSVDTDAI